MRTKYFSIHRYIQDLKINKAKKLKFPSLRGNLLPSIDLQYGKNLENYGGVAINWLFVRVKFCWS